MNNLVFDTSSLISIATNSLLDVFEELKKRFEGEFYITEAVKREIIDVPITSKKFKLEAIQISSLVDKGVIKIFNNLNLKSKTESALEIMNNIFYARKQPIKIVDAGEVEALILASSLNGIYVVDERTIRLLIENPNHLMNILGNKLHDKISMDNKNLKLFKELSSDVRVIRSSELMTIAFEKGLFNDYKANKKELLDGLLWGLRLRGCAISTEEIEETIKLEKLK